MRTTETHEYTPIAHNDNDVRLSWFQASVKPDTFTLIAGDGPRINDREMLALNVETKGEVLGRVLTFMSCYPDAVWTGDYLESWSWEPCPTHLSGTQGSRKNEWGGCGDGNT
jgi:hypothetical protein